MHKRTLITWNMKRSIVPGYSKFWSFRPIVPMKVKAKPLMILCTFSTYDILVFCDSCVTFISVSCVPHVRRCPLRVLAWIWFLSCSKCLISWKLCSLCVFDIVCTTFLGKSLAIVRTFCEMQTLICGFPWLFHLRPMDIHACTSDV